MEEAGGVRADNLLSIHIFYLAAENIKRISAVLLSGFHFFEISKPLTPDPLGIIDECNQALSTQPK